MLRENIFTTNETKGTKVLCQVRMLRENIFTTKETKDNKRFMSGAYCGRIYLPRKKTKVLCQMCISRENIFTTKETKDNKRFMSGAYAAGEQYFPQRTRRSQKFSVIICEICVIIY